MKKVSYLLFSLLLILSFSGCKKKTKNKTEDIKQSEQSKKPTKKEIQKLASIKNISLSDDYILTFDKVENAVSYEISFDYFDYTDIGDVNEIDLSNTFARELILRAKGDQVNYSYSPVSIIPFEHFTNVFTSFEGEAGPDEWSGAYVGYGEILGTTNEKSHSGENSFKIFATNSQNYFGGILFDTEYYAPYEAIDFEHVKTISYWVYLDTKDINQIQALCEMYSSIYNENIENVDYVYGIEPLGMLKIFYSEGPGDGKTFDEYDGKQVPTNTWVKLEFDVSDYKTISDIILMYGNNDRGFTGNNEPGNWMKISPYSYILYIDDIEVEYESAKLETVEEIFNEGNLFYFTEVENAKYYMVTLDGINYEKIIDPEFEAPSNVEMFGVKAVNDTLYSDGTRRFIDSDTKYYIKNNAEKLSPVTSLKSTIIGNAVFKNGIKWNKNPNAYGYAISKDGINFEYIGDVSEYKVDQIYDCSKVYIKALSNKINYKDSDAVEVKIPMIHNLADFEGDRSYYVGNDNFTLISSSDQSHYGKKSFVISRSELDNEGNPYARCHLQPELLINFDFSKVAFLNYYIKVNDILSNGNELNELLYGSNGGFIRIVLESDEFMDCTINANLLKDEWIQVSSNISAIAKKTIDDPLKEIRIYSYLFERMFDSESDSTLIALNSSFNVYFDDLVFVMDDSINLDDIEDKIYGNLDLNDGSIKLGNIEGDIIAIRINGDNAEYEYTNNTVTFIKEDVSTLERGKDYLVEIVTTSTKYNYIARTLDLILSNKDELELMFDRLNGTNLIVDGKYLFDEDIDATNVSLGSNALEFKGIIDGDGHKVYNLNVSNSIGMVKEIKDTGTIKNIAFINGIGSRVFLIYQNSGTIENVFVDAKIVSSWQWYGVIGTIRNDITDGLIKNCIFVVEIESTGGINGGVSGALYQDQGNVINSYFVKENTDSIIPFIGTNTENAPLISSFTNVYGYTKVNDMLKTIALNEEDGWNTSMFSLKGHDLYIQDELIYEYKEYEDTYYISSTKELKVEIFNQNVKSVVVNNVEQAFTYENGIIKFESFETTEEELLVKVTLEDNSIYSYKANIISTLYTADYDLYSNTAVLSAFEGTINSITINNISIEYTLNGNLLTINSGITLESGKTYSLKIETIENIYVYSLSAFDIVVSNATELQEMMNRLNGDNLVVNGKYILDQDIDASTVTVGAKPLEFTGFIDGRGHIVSNLKSNGTLGIVKELKGGVIKNIAFTNGAGSRVFLVYQNSGTIENVYVEATVPTSYSWYGCVGTIRNDGQNGLIKNSVFNITLPNNEGAYGGVAGALYTGGGSLENCYLINNGSASGTVYLGSNGGSETDISQFTNVFGYSDVSQAIDSISFNENNGWKYFAKDGDLITFNGNTILTK